MRLIRDGKVYDTDTATEICYTGNNLPDGDFEANHTALYRSPMGQYFVAGWTGAKGDFARTTEDGWTGGGEGIAFLDEEEAKADAQAHMKAADYERVFGALPEG